MNIFQSHRYKSRPRSRSKDKLPMLDKLTFSYYRLVLEIDGRPYPKAFFDVSHQHSHIV